MISPHGRPPDEAGVYLSCSPGTVIDLLSASPPYLYSAMISTMVQGISAQPKWENSLPGELPPSSWPLLYKLPFKTIRETKMQAFQFKILHRILPCKSYLKAIHIVSDDTCPFCSEQDTLTHFLYDCPQTSTFWNKVAAWLRKVGGPDIPGLSVKEIVLGYLHPSASERIVNHITIFTKFFIQRQKLFHGGSLSLIEWLSELKRKLLTEEYICSLEHRKSRFSGWRKILLALG